MACLGIWKGGTGSVGKGGRDDTTGTVRYKDGHMKYDKGRTMPVESI